jgi:uncharacterized protein
MRTQSWATSPRQYEVVVERSVKIPISDGVYLNCDIFRPASSDRFPAILSASPYSLELQSAPVRSKSFSSVGGTNNPGDETANSLMEAGDPWFFARHGYVHVIMNVRGSGDSTGVYGFTNRREVEDIAEAIEWAAQQPWCSGAVGMFGVSYFAITQHLVGGISPKSLKCLFAPFGSGGFREVIFHGGVLNARWLGNWAETLEKPNLQSLSIQEFGETLFKKKIEEALSDPDLAAQPRIREALRRPLEGANSLITDVILHREDGEFWQERTPDYENIKVPIYVGACWGSYGIHLPPLTPAWARISAYKKMVVGPPLYLDRPVFQFQYESLRWFDQWLKDTDTGVHEDPAVRFFMMGSNDWHACDEWPPRDARWTPFYLHERQLLSEREHWWRESHETFFDTPWQREGVEYWTPRLIDHVEIVGPLGLELYAACTHKDVRWIVSLIQEDTKGKRKLLTKGALEGSFQQSMIDGSPPYAPKYDFSQRRELVPGEIYKFVVGIAPTAVRLAPGTRLGIRISCTDDPPENSLEGAAAGHLRSASARRVAVYHDDRYPSCLWVPVIRGNVIGTFLGGGDEYFDFSVT